MPVYCFTNRATGQTIERTFHVEHVPKSVQEGRKTYVRDIPAEHGGFRHTNLAGWPVKSTALGCHLSQIDEFEKVTREHGCPTRWDRSTGQAIFDSPGQRKKVIRLFGCVDKDGYGT